MFHLITKNWKKTFQHLMIFKSTESKSSYLSHAVWSLTSVWLYVSQNSSLQIMVWGKCTQGNQIKSYLSDSRQIVAWNWLGSMATNWPSRHTTLSDTCSVRGLWHTQSITSSVLGPLLLVVVINDLYVCMVMFHYLQKPLCFVPVTKILD